MNRRDFFARCGRVAAAFGMSFKPLGELAAERDEVVLRFRQPSGDGLILAIPESLIEDTVFDLSDFIREELHQDARRRMPFGALGSFRSAGNLIKLRERLAEAA